MPPPNLTESRRHWIGQSLETTGGDPLDLPLTPRLVSSGTRHTRSHWRPGSCRDPTHFGSRRRIRSGVARCSGFGSRPGVASRECNCRGCEHMADRRLRARCAERQDSNARRGHRAASVGVGIGPSDNPARGGVPVLLVGRRHYSPRAVRYVRFVRASVRCNDRSTLGSFPPVDDGHPGRASAETAER